MSRVGQGAGGMTSDAVDGLSVMLGGDVGKLTTMSWVTSAGAASALRDVGRMATLDMV